MNYKQALALKKQAGLLDVIQNNAKGTALGGGIGALAGGAGAYVLYRLLNRDKKKRSTLKALMYILAGATGLGVLGAAVGAGIQDGKRPRPAPAPVGDSTRKDDNKPPQAPSSEKPQDKVEDAESPRVVTNPPDDPLNDFWLREDREDVADQVGKTQWGGVNPLIAIDAGFTDSGEFGILNSPQHYRETERANVHEQIIKDYSDGKETLTWPMLSWLHDRINYDQLRRGEEGGLRDYAEYPEQNEPVIGSRLKLPERRWVPWYDTAISVGPMYRGFIQPEAGKY